MKNDERLYDAKSRFASTAGREAFGFCVVHESVKMFEI